jgi:hypothetical protein
MYYDKSQVLTMKKIYKDELRSKRKLIKRRSNSDNQLNKITDKPPLSPKKMRRKASPAPIPSPQQVKDQKTAE